MKQYLLREAQVRLCLKEGAALYSAVPLSNPESAVDVIKDLLKDLDREMILVVNLDIKNRPINYNIVSIGGIGATVCTVANLYKSAILSNSARIIMFHNHPSGELTPSKEDTAITKRVYDSGALLGIPLIDHIIVAGENTYSFFQECPDLFS